MDDKFSWPSYPQTEDDFNHLMLAVDDNLAKKDLKPFQRTLHVGRLFWEAFGWGGLAIPPKELAERPGYAGDVLMAKSYRWYEDRYGDQLKAPMAYGFAPVKLGNAVWSVRAGVVLGRAMLFIDRNLANKGNAMGSRNVEASLNVLTQIEGLPQGLANSLSDAALRSHFEFHLLVHQTLQWRSLLPNIELFDTAQADYDASTDNVLQHRYGQARWSSQQAAEKTLKGLLTLGGTSFSTKGADGHNLKKLGESLQTNHGIAITPELLTLASCSPAVRYGEESSTQDQAIASNHAVLHVLEQLSRNPNTEVLLARHKEL